MSPTPTAAAEPAGATARLLGYEGSIAELYREQRPCRQFGLVPIALSHCYETYTLLRRHLNRLRGGGKQTFSIDTELTPLIGLFHHVSPSRVAAISAGGGAAAATLRSALETYDKMGETAIRRYLEKNVDRPPPAPDRLGETSPQDGQYSRLLQAIVGEATESGRADRRTLLPLLFFDLYSGLDCQARGDAGSECVVPLSRFVLRVLPLVLGGQQYGAYTPHLQDRAFHNLHPELCRRVRDEIDGGCASPAVLHEVKEGLLEIAREIPAEVRGRRKGAYSAHLKSLYYDTRVADLWDLSAFRVVIASEDEGDCYAFLSKVEERWGRWQAAKGYYDYLVSTKENKYESIHTVVETGDGHLVEVQIRTQLMDHFAEEGPAAHHAYKLEIARGKETSGASVAERGRLALEKALADTGLSMKDFFRHVGAALEHVPVEHYYEGIARGEYDLSAIVRAIGEQNGERS